MYCWAWFILTAIFTVAAVRSSWVLLLTLFFLDVELLLLAAGYMAGSTSVLKAANSVGFAVGFCACESFFAKLNERELMVWIRLGWLCWVVG
jgi:succinate-acetate transporter protein